VPEGSESQRPEGLLRWPTYALGQLHLVARARIDAALAAGGLSVRSHAVLVCLDEYGEVSQQYVADRVAIDRSDLVKVLDQLESLGQVQRRPDPRDRRRHVLTLTDAGRHAARTAEQSIGQATDEIFSALSAQERRTLHRLALRALGEPDRLADEPGRTA
jgi:DNA-binding MarR family transcriptional regulator